LNNYINAVSKLIAENDIANSNINKGLDDQIAQYNTLEKEIESQKTSESLLAQAKEAYGKAMAQVQNQEKAGFIDAEGAMAKRLQAEQQYIQALSGLRNEYGQLEGVTDRQREDIAALEAAHIADAAALETVIAYQKEYAAETERLRAQYEGVTAEMGGQASLAEIMAEEAERRARELERQRDAELAALETRYAAIAAERESGELTEEETEHREALTDAINKNYDALQKLGKTEAVAAAQKGIAGYAGEIKDQYDGILRDLAEQRIMRDESLSDYEKEIALNQMARDAALDELDARFGALEAQREGLGLTEEEAALKKELTRQINGNYDAIRRGIKEAEKEGVNFKEVTLQIARASVNAFTSVTSAVATIAQNRAAEAMAEVDRVLGETQKHIEDARLEALEAEGFIEAQRAENMQAQIDAAIEANDEVLQYQLERRKREMEINEEYDAQAKAEQEKAEKEKAELEYKAARTKYEMDITNAIVTGAMAISNAIAAGWGAGFPMGPVLAGVFGTAAAVSTGAQLAVIRSNPPALKYATGGIVPGQTHAGTDTVAAMLTPGEVILNRAQQENLAPQLGGGPLTVVVNLDGRPIAETVIKDYVNRGLVLIEAKRGIR
jgi:hypothetical protein